MITWVPAATGSDTPEYVPSPIGVKAAGSTALPSTVTESTPSVKVTIDR